MYEKLRTELIASLRLKTDMKTIETVMPVVDRILNDYDITKKVKDLVPYDYSDPECLNIYLACLDIGGYSKGTIRNYGYSIRRFLQTVKKPVQYITTNDIRLYLEYYKKQFKVDDSSREKIRQYINSFMKWCHIEGYTDSNPCERIPPIKCEKKERKPLTVKEMERILYHCRNLFDRAVMEMLYSTGCRVSELCNIKKEDVDWEHQQILVEGKGKKERYLCLSDSCMLYLEKYLATRKDNEEWLFIRKYKKEYLKRHPNAKPYAQLTTGYIEARIKYLAGKASVKKYVCPHIVRHTTATVMLQKGAPIEIIQEILGHASINTTEIYAKHRPEEIRMEHRRCFS